MENINKFRKMLNNIKQNVDVIILLFFNCIIFSCNVSSKENIISVSNAKEMVTIYDYQLWWLSDDFVRKDLRDSTVTYLDTMILFSRKNWIYFELGDTLSLDPSYAIEKDSFFLTNVYCPNLGTIHLKYKNELVELTVSHYDIENSYDEERYVYWNHDYGLVALYNYPWGVLILFDRETIKGFAKEIFYDDFINRAKERRKAFIIGEFQQFIY